MPDASIARVLALPGYGVYQDELDEDQRTLTLWVRQVGKRLAYTCRGCGISTAATHGTPGERRVRDLPWGPWTVWLVVGGEEATVSQVSSLGNPPALPGDSQIMRSA